MEQLRPDSRLRDRTEEIRRRHGDVRIRTLRAIYGTQFAGGADDAEMLRDVIARLDAACLGQLLRHHDRDELEGHIDAALDSDARHLSLHSRASAHDGLKAGGIIRRL